MNPSGSGEFEGKVSYKWVENLKSKATQTEWKMMKWWQVCLALKRDKMSNGTLTIFPPLLKKAPS